MVFTYSGRRRGKATWEKYEETKKGCIKMLPRFKIQYPMKNHCKDEGNCNAIQEGNYFI
jgi:hypothetical protein